MKIFFVSLGCDKNLVDSEKMLYLLRSEGFELTDEEEAADVIVVNTCCFIHDAKEESIETILEMARWKEAGSCKVLIAAGCLAQRYHKEIKEELPEVDGIVGTTAIDKIAEVIKSALNGKGGEALGDLNELPKEMKGRVNADGRFTSYLKIAEGCNKCCSYCIIPKLRGKYRSVPMEDLIEEAEQLARDGIKELILVAQETTLYGTDLYGEKKLPELLQRLCQIPNIKMIRLLYCYPEEITEQLAETLRDEKKICHYIDMPIQHCNDRILKKMGRRTNRAELVEKITMLRETVPDIALRTTLITGFPGETKAEHEELLAFVREMRFDRLGVFTYSPEENTPAAAMDGQLDEDVKLRRKEELMNVQQDVVFSKNESLIGRTFQVIVDGMIPEENIYVGRTYMDIPDIDGCIFFEAEGELISGTLVEVTVTDAKGYDLIGDMKGEVDD
ncbi:MAG: 30S ribosomal protein S12 methylthiotransferase RimO [Lachnospiraceae bacterium]|nr:30S ribosomal protein S12 methylthiotransferase RimO [Lachnospiraceae bacterium]